MRPRYALVISGVAACSCTRNRPLALHAGRILVCQLLIGVLASRWCEGFGVCAYSLHGENNETFAAGFYPDRTDDRGGDRRYPGGHRAAGVSGLCDSVEDV